MAKGFWAGLLAGVAAVVAAVLYALIGRKPTPQKTSSEKASDFIKDLQNNASQTIEDIQSKTDAEIIEEHTTPAQKEAAKDVVNSQVDKAMQSASKYKRKKP